MDRRFALVALWAVFAAAAVGVGFGAAGLVGDPFTTGTTGAATAGGASGPSNQPAPTSPTSTSSRSPSASTPAGTEATRTLSTRAGFVSATCRAGAVVLSASPAVGWQIDEIEDGEKDEGRVRFERSGDGEGRVEVDASCRSGTPQFAIEDDSSGHGADERDDDEHDDD